MQSSLAVMTYDELLLHKLKLHHLHRDYRIEQDAIKDPDLHRRFYHKFHRLDAAILRVYAELERRKPGVKY